MVRNRPPPHQPGAEQRAMVLALASVGVPHEVIADKLGVSGAVLRRHYTPELERGLAEANAQVVAALFRAATQGSVPAAKWWTQTRLGWRDHPAAADRAPAARARRGLRDLTTEDLLALAARLIADQETADQETADQETVGQETAQPEAESGEGNDARQEDPDPDGDG